MDYVADSYIYRTAGPTEAYIYAALWSVVVVPTQWVEAIRRNSEVVCVIRANSEVSVVIIRNSEVRQAVLAGSEVVTTLQQPSEVTPALERQSEVIDKIILPSIVDG